MLGYKVIIWIVISPMASDIATTLFEELGYDDVLKSSLQITCICSLVFFFWSGNDMGVLKQMWSGQLVWVHCSIKWVLHYFILSKISALFTSHCLVSNWGGLGTSPSILGLLTKDQQSQNENKEFYMCIIILISFGVNWANIEQHIHVAIKTLKIY